MLHYLFRVEKFIPFLCRKTVYDIDYSKLYENGRRILLIDLDNTLIPYDEQLPDENLIALFNNLKEKGFNIIIISNNRAERVKRFAEAVDCEFIYSALKPLKHGYQRALKKLYDYDHKEIISIGDQIMTDVLGSSRLGLDCILVKPIKKKSEKWYTKVNRKFENLVLKRIKKKYPEKYNEIMILKENNES